ncbi:MAG: TatD family hydrolase [Polynucleobacter sp.]|jgi:TatD DNase family protein|nr:TatD family hydrolase [Polynucleobacter sp.]
MWLDTHCHLDAPEFLSDLDRIIDHALENQVEGILLPAVRAHDFVLVQELVERYQGRMPNLVYTLGIHPLYTDRAQDKDLKILEDAATTAILDPHFVGIGEIGLDYFVDGLDPRRQAFFYEGQLAIAEALKLPVILHVRRSQDMILKGLRSRNIVGGIAHAFNGSFQQAEQFIQLQFKLGFGGAATYERALQIRRLLKDLPIESIVTETDSPDIPPAWLRDSDVRRNEPAFVARIAESLAEIRGIAVPEFARTVKQNALNVLPRWSNLLAA